MRLKILAVAAALFFPALAAAQTGGGVAICDTSGKCVSGTSGSATSAIAPAPVKSIVIAAPPEPKLAPNLQLVRPASPPPAPVAETVPTPPPAPEPVEVAAPTYAPVPVQLPSESGEVVVVTQASGPATSTLDSYNGALPGKGMNRGGVASQFGQPHTKHAAVGGGSRQQPPITRWDYDGFSVFFEYDHVVDAVERDNPAPIAVYDGLAGGPQSQ